jgi:hypothetical protein
LDGEQVRLDWLVGGGEDGAVTGKGAAPPRRRFAYWELVALVIIGSALFGLHAASVFLALALAVYVLDVFAPDLVDRFLRQFE